MPRHSVTARPPARIPAEAWRLSCPTVARARSSRVAPAFFGVQQVLGLIDQELQQTDMQIRFRVDSPGTHHRSLGTAAPRRGGGR